MIRLLTGAGAFAAATGAALFVGATPASAPDRQDGVVHLRLLGVNDLHGHLEPPRPGAGGVAWLDAHLDAATLPGHTIRVNAGDMVGASPPGSPIRLGASYEVVASELLLDHLPVPADGHVRHAGTEVEALASYVEARLR